MANLVKKHSISSELAQKMVDAAVAKARDLGVCVNVMILDHWGNLKAFHRMDGAPLLRLETAHNRAYNGHHDPACLPLRPAAPRLRPVFCDFSVRPPVRRLRRQWAALIAHGAGSGYGRQLDGRRRGPVRLVAMIPGRGRAGLV